MALSEHEQRQLDAIEQALERDRRTVLGQLWSVGGKVAFLGVALGVCVSVLIGAFLSSSSDVALFSLGSLALVLLVLANCYARTRDSSS